MEETNQQSIWTKDDEKEHASDTTEWWNIEAFFKTIRDNKKWSLKATFTEWQEKPKKCSIFGITLFDIDNDKNYHYQMRDETKRLQSSNNKELYIGYENSYIKGSYPNYESKLEDKKNNIFLDLQFKSQFQPRWVAQNITKGWLPLGLGFYRYGFIPKNKLNGFLSINNEKFEIDGNCYYEHVRGDFTYHKLGGQLKNLKKSISIYAKLIGWQLKNHKIKIPRKIKFSINNNPFSYDWSWILLDNGWTIFYGNSLFFIKEGPIAGVVILTKDGGRYEEFVDVNFKYLKTKKSKELDFEYPIELEISAKKGNKKLNLKFTKTIEPLEHIKKTTGEKLWKGIAVCEVIGKIDGYYFDGKKKTKLNGIYKFEPQRQISKF